MIRARRIVSAIVVLVLLPVVVWGFENKRTRETLRGINGVSVVVEAIEPEIEKAGLTREQIKTDVEQKLFVKGLNVLTPETGGAFLYVGLLIVKHEKLSSYFQVDLYLYTIELKLNQGVFLERNKKPTTATTWSIVALGANKDVGVIRNAIKGCVDIFLSSWLSVNPK
jgi:hypothetical protein